MIIEKEKALRIEKISIPDFDKIIYSHLIAVAKEQHGLGQEHGAAVSACIVREDKIIVSAPSAVTGVIIHAEQNVLGYAKKMGIIIEPSDILYTTL